jgi:hypothetical protein
VQAAAFEHAAGQRGTAVDGLAAVVARARGGAAAPDGRPTEPSWLGRDAGAARGREPESDRIKNE